MDWSAVHVSVWFATHTGVVGVRCGVGFFDSGFVLLFEITEEFVQVGCSVVGFWFFDRMKVTRGWDCVEVVIFDTVIQNAEM